jgi:hypothetical protein
VSISVSQEFTRLIFLHAPRQTSILAELPEESEWSRFFRSYSRVLSSLISCDLTVAILQSLNPGKHGQDIMTSGRVRPLGRFHLLLKVYIHDKQ